MKHIYICSPLRGDIETNTQKAKKYCQIALLHGYLPIAPHVYFTQFLDDNVDKQRQLGLELGLYLLRYCSEIWVYGKPSEGMMAEIELAQQLKIDVVYKNA